MTPPPPAVELARWPPASEGRWFADQVLPLEPLLRAWLHRRFPKLTDVDDLVQESYARLLRAHAGGQVRNVRNYLFATARNAALDLFRRERVIRTEPIGENLVPFVLEVEPDATERIGRQEELEILREAIQALPTRCRRVFTLRKLYGLSHREITQQMGISQRTVEAQIDKAMRRCTAYLRFRGLP
ncbi:MAG: RNA polymerase sigma factor [Verrucomicrobia bacterium]|nr:RNA polymerase sigma factor [Verrucomicrobiota bacterium]